MRPWDMILDTLTLLTSSTKDWWEGGEGLRFRIKIT